MVLSYFRSVCKQSFFKTCIPEARGVLLSRPVNLGFERHCLEFYLQLLEFLQNNLEKMSTLKNDENLLEGKPSPSECTTKPLSWPYRMALVYRLEKKQIIRN